MSQKSVCTSVALISLSQIKLIDAKLLIAQLPLYKTGQCGCMRAATALNLRAVLMSSEKRHISNPTLIVSHFYFLITRQGSLLFTPLSSARARRRKFRREKRSNRSKANEGLNYKTVTLSQKRIAKKDGKACGKTQKIFRFHCASHSHTRTVCFACFPFALFVSQRDLLLPSQSHFHTACLFLPFCLLRN